MHSRKKVQTLILTKQISDCKQKQSPTNKKETICKIRIPQNNIRKGRFVEVKLKPIIIQPSEYSMKSYKNHIRMKVTKALLRT